MAYRIANGAWGLLFAAFAALQLNDPDPFRWVFVYGFAALMCGLAVRGELPERPALGYGVVSGLLSVSALYSWNADGPDIAGRPSWGGLKHEVLREAVGLALVSLWMTTLFFWTRRIRASEE